MPNKHHLCTFQQYEPVLRFVQICSLRIMEIGSDRRTLSTSLSSQFSGEKIFWRTVSIRNFRTRLNRNGNAADGSPISYNFCLRVHKQLLQQSSAFRSLWWKIFDCLLKKCFGVLPDFIRVSPESGDEALQKSFFSLESSESHQLNQAIRFRLGQLFSWPAFICASKWAFGEFVIAVWFIVRNV